MENIFNTLPLIPSPQGRVQIFNFDALRSLPQGSSQEADMDVIQAIKERRAINIFEPGKEVSDEKLKELLSIANLSPSSFNLQPWKIIVVRDPERKKILRQCAFNQPKVEEASAVLI